MKRVWRSAFCAAMALVIGASGFVAGTLPAYGETGMADEAESVIETVDKTEAESGSGSESEEAPKKLELETEGLSGLKPEILLPVESGTEIIMESEQGPESEIIGEGDGIVPNITETMPGSEGSEMMSEEISLYGAAESRGSVSAQSSKGLKLTVDYPDNILCGQPVTFTMNASGGSGNYKYRIHTLSTLNGSETVSVYDVSYGKNSEFTTDNTFKFTFYASGEYVIRFHLMDMTSYDYVVTPLDHKIKITDPSHPSVDEIVQSLAAECKTKYPDNGDEYNRALWLHDKIIELGEYDYSYTYCSAEGVLARGVGTCESYHRAYVMLLKAVGIETGRITGNGHVWTAVRLGGNWYQVDTTWDDKGVNNKDKDLEHMYFGLTDYMMGLVHSDHKSG